MELKHVVLLTGLGIGAFRAFDNYHRIKAEEQEKRRVIQKNLEKDLEALAMARGRVMERIDQGKYAQATYGAVLNDLRFETIVARYDEE